MTTLPPEIELAQLLQQCAAQDSAAFRTLYDKTSPILFARLLRMLRRRSVAEEALQDVYVRIWQRAAQYEAGRGRALAWMVTIARYCAIDLMRRERMTLVSDDSLAEIADESSTESEAVEEAADDPDAVQHFSGRIKVEAGRLGRLVQQIIELSRLQDDQALDSPAVVEVDALISSCIDAVAVEAKAKDIEVVHDGRRDLRVLGNAQQVSLALGNLVSNALRHTTRGGVLLALRRRQDMVVFEVWDTGVGIAREHQQAIFQEFFRVSQHQGTEDSLGLGLTIVSKLATLMGYQLALQSEASRGSVFRVMLPAYTQQEGAPAPQPTVVQS